MRKSERKANTILAKAKSYVASYTLTLHKPKQEPKLEQKPKQEPKLEQKPKQEPKDCQVKNAEIIKLSKGHFSIIVELVNGQTVTIPKRFKSVTKASLWISKHKNDYKEKI